MEYIHTPGAPAAVGPYSQATRVGRMVFASGQVALKPEGGLDIETAGGEVHQIMANLNAVLGAASCTFGDVAQTRIYLSDMGLFSAVNQVYSQYFPEGKAPARECVIARAPIKGPHIEIGMTAVIPWRRFFPLLLSKALSSSKSRSSTK